MQGAGNNDSQRPPSPSSEGPATKPQGPNLIDNPVPPSPPHCFPSSPASAAPFSPSRVQRFRQGYVYSRRARGSVGAARNARQADTPACRARALRFHPGVFYTRRPRGTETSGSTRANASPHAVVAATNFIASMSSTLPAPLLQPPQRRGHPPPRRDKQMEPKRRSLRIAALNWPKGNAQAKARLVLLKKLGMADEKKLSADDLILRCVKLFKGPLTDKVYQAITTLCGLDGAPASVAA